MRTPIVLGGLVAMLLMVGWEVAPADSPLRCDLADELACRPQFWNPKTCKCGDGAPKEIRDPCKQSRGRADDQACYSRTMSQLNKDITEMRGRLDEVLKLCRQWQAWARARTPAHGRSPNAASDSRRHQQHGTPADGVDEGP